MVQGYESLRANDPFRQVIVLERLLKVFEFIFEAAPLSHKIIKGSVTFANEGFEDRRTNHLMMAIGKHNIKSSKNKGSDAMLCYFITKQQQEKC